MREKGKSQEVTPVESAKIKLIVLLSDTRRAYEFQFHFKKFQREQKNILKVYFKQLKCRKQWQEQEFIK